MINAQNKLISDFTDLVATIPGVVSFAAISEQTPDAIIINDFADNEYQIEIVMAIIIDSSISSKNIAKQIYEIINFRCKQANLTLAKLDLLIQGVK